MHQDAERLIQLLRTDVAILEDRKIVPRTSTDDIVNALQHCCLALAVLLEDNPYGPSSIDADR